MQEPMLPYVKPPTNWTEQEQISIPLVGQQVERVLLVVQTILNPIYSASPADVTAGSVVLTLSAETDPPCVGNISDSIILTFEETPIVDAGQDATICEGDSYILSEANTENTTTTLWTTNGDGVFDDPTTVNTTYNPGTDDVQNGTVTLTLTGAGSPLCDRCD